MMGSIATPRHFPWSRAAPEIPQHKKMQDLVKNAQAHFESLSSLGVATATKHQLKGDVFVDVTIEGHRYQARVRGRELIMSPVRRTGAGEFIQLGAATIKFKSDCHRTPRMEPTWWVCKHGWEPRIPLAGLSEDGVRALAVEFGLAIYPHQSVDHSIQRPAAWIAFYGSKAWVALIEWSKCHPRKTKEQRGSDYLGHWGHAALTLNVPTSPAVG